MIKTFKYKIRQSKKKSHSELEIEDIKNELQENFFDLFQGCSQIIWNQSVWQWPWNKVEWSTELSNYSFLRSWISSEEWRFQNSFLFYVFLHYRFGYSLMGWRLSISFGALHYHLITIFYLLGEIRDYPLCTIQLFGIGKNFTN